MAKNIEGFKRFQKERSENTKRQVLSVINRLYEFNEVVNFNVVAKEAKVSRSYLYGQEEISRLINELKGPSLIRKSKKVRALKSSPNSQDAKLKTVIARCNRLKKENDDLKSELQTLREYIETLTNG